MRGTSSTSSTSSVAVIPDKGGEHTPGTDQVHEQRTSEAQLQHGLVALFVLVAQGCCFELF